MTFWHHCQHSCEMLRILTVLLVNLSLTGCYYMQAASGQWEVIRKREPLREVIGDPETPGELSERLQLMSDARDFSIAVLGLPDNGSYRSYSDIEREYVVWNVFAAPEFSFAPRQWCFPVAGCVSYRGYFRKGAAIKESERLAASGLDVAVGGVVAYSTLGKFNDPILSTMMRWSDVNIVAVLFHELAHQVVYVKGDTAFNESFATAVEEFGIERWLEHRGQREAMEVYRAGRELQQRLLDMVVETRQNLQPVYDSDRNATEKRALKAERLKQLATDVAAELERSGREASGWLTSDLNNARLISTTLYQGYVPVFREIFESCEKEFACFYAETERLAKLRQPERDAALSTGNPERL